MSSRSEASPLSSDYEQRTTGLREEPVASPSLGGRAMGAGQLDRDVPLSGLTPAFDVQTKSWFIELEGKEYEASTMRELRSVLRVAFPARRISFLGYFPQGRDVTSLERGTSITRDRIAADRRAHEMAKEAYRHEPKPPKINHREAVKIEPVTRERHHDHEAILNLWSSGLRGKDIAVRTGTAIETVYGIVTAARGRGDSRAVKRHPGYVTAAPGHNHRDHTGATCD